MVVETLMGVCPSTREGQPSAGPVLAQGIRLGLISETRLTVGKLTHDWACHERGLAERRGRVEWCGRKDSNLHGVAPTSS